MGFSHPIWWKIFVIGIIDSVDALSCYATDGKKLWQNSAGSSWNILSPESRVPQLVRVTECMPWAAVAG